MRSSRVKRVKRVKRVSKKSKRSTPKRVKRSKKNRTKRVSRKKRVSRNKSRRLRGGAKLPVPGAGFVVGGVRNPFCISGELGSGCQDPDDAKSKTEEGGRVDEIKQYLRKEKVGLFSSKTEELVKGLRGKEIRSENWLPTLKEERQNMINAARATFKEQLIQKGLKGLGGDEISEERANKLFDYFLKLVGCEQWENCDSLTSTSGDFSINELMALPPYKNFFSVVDTPFQESPPRGSTSQQRQQRRAAGASGLTLKPERRHSIAGL
jgi:hypothetical protein